MGMFRGNCGVCSPDVWLFGPNGIGNDPLARKDDYLYHEDPTGAYHDLYGEGLRKFLFNYMHGVGFELPLKKWFDFKVPRTTVPPTYIDESISATTEVDNRANALAVWLGGVPSMQVFEEQEGDNTIEVAELEFYTRKNQWTLTTGVPVAEWLMNIPPELGLEKQETLSMQHLKARYESQGLGSFVMFTTSYIWQELRSNGLLIV